MAKPAVRDDARARAARPTLLLRRALAHRPGSGRGERNPVSRSARRLGDTGRSGGGPTAAAEARRHPAAPRQSPSRHARRQRGRAAAGTQPRVPQLHDQRKSRFGRTARSVVRTLRRRSAARPPAAPLSAAAPRRTCRHSRRTEGNGRAARRPRLADAERVRGRSPGRTRDAERAVDRDVHACAAARQRDGRRPSGSPCSGRSSPPGAGGGRSVQRACARMVAAGPCTSVQHVASDARPPVSGEARKIAQRSPDRHPDDARSERAEEIVPFHRRCGGGGWVSIGSGLPACLQEPHGRDSGAVAQDTGAVRPGRLREACSNRRCEACGDVRSGSSCQAQASEGRRCALAGRAKIRDEVPIRPPTRPRPPGSRCSRARRRHRRWTDRSG